MEFKLGAACSPTSDMIGVHISRVVADLLSPSSLRSHLMESHSTTTVVDIPEKNEGETRTPFSTLQTVSLIATCTMAMWVNVCRSLFRLEIITHWHF